MGTCSDRAASTTTDDEFLGERVHSPPHRRARGTAERGEGAYPDLGIASLRAELSAAEYDDATRADDAHDADGCACWRRSCSAGKLSSDGDTRSGAERTTVESEKLSGGCFSATHCEIGVSARPRSMGAVQHAFHFLDGPADVLRAPRRRAAGPGLLQGA